MRSFAVCAAQDDGNAGRLRYPARMKKKSRDLVRTYSRRQFVDKIRRLADALENGKGFVIQIAGERLRIPASVTFNIEHERQGSSHELEFQLLWDEESE
jgi:amphi-Trp domain-containing protein